MFEIHLRPKLHCYTGQNMCVIHRNVRVYLPEIKSYAWPTKRCETASSPPQRGKYQMQVYIQATAAEHPLS
jgi:hypothetical protein